MCCGVACAISYWLGTGLVGNSNLIPIFVHPILSTQIVLVLLVPFVQYGGNNKYSINNFFFKFKESLILKIINTYSISYVARKQFKAKWVGDVYNTPIKKYATGGFNSSAT